MEALALRPSQVVLGEPGAGKSTLLAFVAYALASRTRRLLPGWPQAGAASVPVLVQLSTMSAWLAERSSGPTSLGSSAAAGDPGVAAVASAAAVAPAGVAAGEAEPFPIEEAPFWEYLRHDLAERNLGFCLDALKTAVAEGRAVLLFDGLDEVPSELVRTVHIALLALRRRPPGCRVVVTCRCLPYSQPDWRLPESEFPVIVLNPFDRTHIERFVNDWFAELAVAGELQVLEAERRGESLCGELKRSHLVRLAANPLQLTLMTLVYGARGEVPETRTRLFEQTLDILVSRMDASLGEHPRMGDLLREVRRDRCDLLGMCEVLGMAAHRAGEHPSDGGGSGDGGKKRAPGFTESDLMEVFGRLNPSGGHDWTQALVERIKQRPGLLREDHPGIYTFVHRAIQEYLAGCRLAHTPNFAQTAAALADARNYWRETILHAVGFMVRVQRENARPQELVERLCPLDAPADDGAWRRSWLAGDAVLEIGLSRAIDAEGGMRTLERVRNRLAALVESGRLYPGERSAAASVLARLGDPRFELHGLHLPLRWRGEREKALGLVPITPGRLAMGSAAGAVPEALANEHGNDEPLQLDYPFWVFRYPVTVAQYRAFVKARGYERREWWTATGWSWLQSEERRGPGDWWRQRHVANHPVVGVTWFEAMAYTRWITAMVRKRQARMPEGYALRLPTEAEWELAARGSAGRLFPWGDAPPEGRANVLGTVGGTSPVGLFPDGATPEGVLDMGGNVWEWTLSLDRPYPYRPEDGRNNPDADGVRIVRGGSYDSHPARARTAARARVPIREHARDIGFRLVLSLADSGV